MCLHDAQRDGKAEPDALPCRLRGEEGLEDSQEVLLVDSRAGVLDDHFVAVVGAPCAEANRSARARRLRGVRHEVRDDLLEARAIEQQRRLRLGDHRGQRDALRREPGPHRANERLEDRAGRLGLSRATIALAHVREQVAHDGARPQRLRLNHLQRHPFVAGTRVRQEIFGEVEYRRERIVQLVRDAGDELAERFDALGVGEPVAKRLALALGERRRRHVRPHAGDAGDGARRVAQRREICTKELFGPRVGRARAPVERDVLATHRAYVRLHEALRRLGRDELDPVRSHERFPCRRLLLRPPAIDRGEPALGVDGVEAEVERSHDETEAMVVVAQGVGLSLRVGDVPREHEHGRLLAPPAERGAARLDPANFAAAPHETDVHLHDLAGERALSRFHDLRPVLRREERRVRQRLDLVPRVAALRERGGIHLEEAAAVVERHDHVGRRLHEQEIALLGVANGLDEAQLQHHQHDDQAERRRDRPDRPGVVSVHRGQADRRVHERRPGDGEPHEQDEHADDQPGDADRPSPRQRGRGDERTVDEEHGAEPLRGVEEVVDRAEEDDVHRDRQRIAPQPRGELVRPRRPRRDDEVQADPQAEHGVRAHVDVRAEHVAEHDERDVDEQRAGMARAGLTDPARSRRLRRGENRVRLRVVRQSGDGVG